jgi:hypothetical protein
MLSEDKSQLNSYLSDVVTQVCNSDDRVVLYDKGSVKVPKSLRNVEKPKNTLMLMEALARSNEHTTLIINRLDRCNLSVVQFLVKLFENNRNVEVYATMLDSVDSGRDLALSMLAFNEIKVLSK